ncbi:MAG: enoyl-CoA hydratase/isomerase family protein [Chloroflexi bacterium]|nr:enoyl-CoA hydratase/isomerase family protein [Chloroflexota bacterium]
MRAYDDYQYILLERRDHGVAVVTLNRPERRNAINNDMHSELERLWMEIGSDDTIRAVVLTGAGRSFCSGGDATSMDDGSFLPSGPATPFRAVRTLMHNMLEVEQPIVAAVNGDAAGLGATIALCCDIIIAGDRARFADTHTKMGLVAGDGGVIIWPALVGWARAKEYLLLGDWVNAEDALRFGMVNRAVSQDDLMPTALAWADRLALAAPKAVRWTKYSLNRVLRAQVDQALDVSTFLEAATMDSADLREAAAAFLQKRQPIFTGE